MYHLRGPVQEQLIAPRNVEGGAGAFLMAYLVGIMPPAQGGDSDAGRRRREAAVQAASEAAAAVGRARAVA